MPISVQCPGCGGKFRAPDEAIGKRAKCPKCPAFIDINDIQPQKSTSSLAAQTPSLPPRTIQTQLGSMPEQTNTVIRPILSSCSQKLSKSPKPMTTRPALWNLPIGIVLLLLGTLVEAIEIAVILSINDETWERSSAFLWISLILGIAIAVVGKPIQKYAGNVGWVVYFLLFNIPGILILIGWKAFDEGWSGFRARRMGITAVNQELGTYETTSELSWLDREVTRNSRFFLISMAVLFPGIGLIMGILMLVFCKISESRKLARLLCTISGVIYGSLAVLIGLIIILRWVLA